MDYESEGERIFLSEKCLEIAKDAWYDGNIEKAVRMAEKSLRFHSNKAATEFLQRLASNEQPTTDEDEEYKSYGSHSTSPTSTSTSPNSPPTTPEAEPIKRTYTPEQAEHTARINQSSSFYDILQVDENASPDDIKRAYKKLALKMHPDKNIAPGAEEAFKRVGSAYNTLSDETSKRHYDASNRDIRKDPYKDYRQASSAQPSRQYEYEEERSGAGDYGFGFYDLFQRMFFGATRERERPRQRTYYTNHGGYSFTFNPGAFQRDQELRAQYYREVYAERRREREEREARFAAELFCGYCKKKDVQRKKKRAQLEHCCNNVYYCNSRCKAADYPNHQPICDYHRFRDLYESSSNDKSKKKRKNRRSKK